MKIMLLYQKYYPEGKSFTVVGADGQEVDAMLNFPPSYIYDSMVIEVAATTSVTSAELEKQSKIPLFNLLTQAYGQVTQFAMGASDPQLPVINRMAAVVAIEGIVTYVADVIADYNLSESRELVRGFREIQEIASFTKQQIMAEVTGGEQGMEGVSGALGGAMGAGGAPVA